MTPAERHVLQCGCAVIASHDRGEVMYRCEGGGLSIPEGCRLVDRDNLDVCPGGIAYAVKATEQRTIRYESRPVHVPGPDAA